MPNKQGIYAYYVHDELVEIGTKKELAKRTGLRIRTLEAYHTPAVLKRGSKRVVVRVGTEGEDDDF